VSSFNLDTRGRVFALNVDNGVVNVLESPDMVPLGPVPLRHGRTTPSARPVRAAEFIRNPGDYVVHGLDGRALHGAPRGVFLAAKKGGGAPGLMMLP
jgi:hypothetical protein